MPARTRRRARAEHQQPRASGSDKTHASCEALELRFPHLFSILSTYFASLSQPSLRIPIPSIAKRPPRRVQRSSLASVSLSQAPPPATPPQPDAQPPDSTPFTLPQWLSRAMQGQLPAALWVVLSPPGQPDKRRLMTVHDFFRYTEEQGCASTPYDNGMICTTGRALFDELDRDGDERVTLDDLKVGFDLRACGCFSTRAFQRTPGCHASAQPSGAVCCRVFESGSRVTVVGQQHHVRPSTIPACLYPICLSCTAIRLHSATSACTTGGTISSVSWTRRNPKF